MKKNITNSPATRTDLYLGAKKLSSVLQSAIGPQNRTVLLSSHGLTPDYSLKGAEIAKEISFRDIKENAGAALFRSIADEIASQHGDGSRLGVLFADNILKNALKLITAGYNPIPLRQGIEKSVSFAVKVLTQMSEKPGKQQLSAVALNAAQDDHIGKLVAEAVDHAGSEGYVHVKVSDTNASYLQQEHAFCVEHGWGSKYMATDNVSQETNLENAAVFVCGASINSIYDILPLLNEVSICKKPLLVFAEHINEDVIRSFVSNISQGTIRICSVEVPGVGPERRAWLDDIAAVTGTVVFGTELYPDLKKAALTNCGYALRVHVTRNQCFIDNNDFSNPKFKKHLTHLQTLRKLENNELEDEILRKRITNLMGCTTILRVGAPTEMERRLLHVQAENAIKCTFNAVSSGILPGGGTAYIRLIPELQKYSLSLPSEERLGAELLIEALGAPVKQIAANAGFIPELVFEKVSALQGNNGFNAATGTYEDMMESGIIDSAGSTIAALKIGACTAAQILTVGAAVLIDGVPLSDLPVPDDLHLTPNDFI